MKTFFVILFVALLGWAGWYYWGKDQVNDIAIVNTETPYPTFTPLGQGGEGPEPEDFVDEEEITPTRTPVAVVTPRRTATPRLTPTATAAPVMAFRTLTAMNGSNEEGVMLIRSDAQGRAVINFNVVGTPAGVSQPVWIYRGTSCQTSTDVMFGLNPLMNGSSMTVLPIRASDLISGDGSLRLVVFQSNAEGAARVSCAVIR